ncbi:hypothetical protein [Candidatus Methylacidithermus pantelleriae]|uniref:hypothetical protein n=1 Tax=Candidatus Methylacidithermus pantelleriae TaxID=2744239 RepID=UPI00157D2C17|nr:hypothetical protein [Candidatus Methylacidithermus pantelleriae]
MSGSERDFALELLLRAGPKGVAPVCELRNTDPFSLVTRRLSGGVGIEINEDHPALGETHCFGNLATIREIGLNLHGKRKHEAKAIFARACKDIRPGVAPNRVRCW